jgi:hypothetical protein
MKSRTKNRARIEWWQIHIEAWQRSGLSQRRYCREHRLDTGTFARWLKKLADVNALKIKSELAREERTERRRRARSALTPDVRSRATRAFWAMHVEVLQWSGMHLNTYAKALRLSRYSLRKWRDLLEGGEQVEDWRARLHPSARANLSTSARPGAKEPLVETGLTDAPASIAKPSRRSFTADEKRAIVLETECPGATVSAIARKHDLVTSVLFRWRAELGFGQDKRAKLATVKLTGGNVETDSASLLLHGLMPPPDGMSPVELGDGRRVFAPIGSDPNAVREQVARQERARC